MTHEYARVVAPADALRLHLNENTAGCSPKVLAAIHGLTRHDVAIYPDYETVTWDLADFDTGLAIGGATLPSETYFVYGTPGADGQDKLLTGWTDRHLV